MSFFCTVLVGALELNCVEFIFGRLKLGMLKFMLGAGDGLVFLAVDVYKRQDKARNLRNGVCSNL